MLCLSLAGFSGCQADGQDVDTELTPSQDQNSTVPPTPSEKTLSLADQAAYEGALQLSDASYCDKVKDPETKTKCHADVSDARKLTTALEKNDAALCKDISNEDRKKACELRVEIEQKELQVREQKKGEIQSQYDRLGTIVAKGNETECAGLEDQNLVTSCLENILTNRAIASKDPSICTKINDQEAQKRCSEASQN